MDRDIIGEPWVLDGSGWEQFTCADCDKPLKLGDEVVMVPVCGGFLCHPAHRDRRKCRTGTR